MAKMVTYRTTADIVIPAGTELLPPPSHSTRWRQDYDALIGHGRDHCSHWSINIEDGLACGVIEQVL